MRRFSGAAEGVALVALILGLAGLFWCILTYL